MKNSVYLFWLFSRFFVLLQTDMTNIRRDNIILALVALGLFALCVLSIVM